MNDTIKALWDSTEQLYRRFDLYPPKLPAVVRVMFEEFAEFTNAIFTSTDGDIAAEGADFIVTVCALLMSKAQTFDALSLVSPVAVHNGYSVHQRLNNLASNTAGLTIAAYSSQQDPTLYGSLAINQTVSLLHTLNLDGAVFEAAAADVMAKNAAKTTATHAVNGAGKIAKRV